MIDKSESPAAVCGVLLEKGVGRLTARPRGLTRLDRERLQEQGVRFAGSPAVPVAKPTGYALTLIAKKGEPKVAPVVVDARKALREWKSSLPGKRKYLIYGKQLAARGTT